VITLYRLLINRINTRYAAENFLQTITCWQKVSGTRQERAIRQIRSVKKSKEGKIVNINKEGRSRLYKLYCEAGLPHRAGAHHSNFPLLGWHCWSAHWILYNICNIQATTCIIFHLPENIGFTDCQSQLPQFSTRYGTFLKKKKLIRLSA